MVAQRFVNAKKPLTATDLSHELGIPIRLIRELLFQLVEATVLDEVKTDDPITFAYQPARDVHQLTTAFVIKAIENRGTHSITFIESKDLGKLSDVLKSFDEAISKSPQNIQLVKI